MKKSIKKVMGLCLAVVTIFSLLTGCNSGKESKVLKVGIMPASVGVPVKYAHEKGFFKEAGLNVELSVFQTGAPINEAIAAKQIDLAASGAATIFSLATGECTLLAELCSSGGMGIYVRPNSDILKAKGTVKERPEVYGSADSVKGKTILGQLGTSSQLNISKYAGLFGLGSKDYKIVHMDAGPALQAFLAGEGDALAAFPPYSFNAESSGMKKITSFEDATGFSIIDPLFGRTKVIEERKEDVVKFVQCVIKANEALKDDKLRAEFSMKFFADNGRTYSQKDMDSEIAVRKYLGKNEYTGKSYVFGKCFTDQGDFYVENGKIKKEQVPNIFKSINPDYLNKALGINVKVEK